MPIALEVHELRISESKGTTICRHIRSYDHLPPAPGAPLTFGADPARNTVIVEGVSDPEQPDLHGRDASFMTRARGHSEPPWSPNCDQNPKDWRTKAHTTE
jgi:hypothetical protein